MNNERMITTCVLILSDEADICKKKFTRLKYSNTADHDSEQYILFYNR